MEEWRPSANTRGLPTISLGRQYCETRRPNLDGGGIGKTKIDGYGGGGLYP